MKASSPPLSSCLLITPRCILSIAIVHLSSFVSPPLLCPHSVHFHFPPRFLLQLLSLPPRSLNLPCLNLRPSPFQPARRGAPSHFLHLSVTSLLHIPFNLLHFYFPLRLLLPSWDIFFLPLPVIGIFFPGSRRLSQHALTFALSVGLALPFHSRKRGPPRTN